MGRTDKTQTNEKKSKELMSIALENIKSLGHKKYNFTFFGGETTFYPDFPEFLDQVYCVFGTNVNQLMFTTNASRGINHFKEYIDRYPNSFVIRVSIHPEHFDLKIFDTIEFLLKQKIRVFVEIMYNLNFKKIVFDSVNHLIKLKKQYNCIMGRIKPVFASLPFDVHDYFYAYTLDDMEDLYDSNLKLGYTTYKYKTDLKDFGKYCILCSNKILIEPNGSILCACPISTPTNINIFYTSPKRLKNIFTVQKCTSKKVCLHAPEKKFNNRNDAVNVLRELKCDKKI